MRRLIRTAIVAVAAILFVSMTCTAARANDGDTTPPTAPWLGYASGLLWTGECQTVTLGVGLSTDDVTPQLDLTYEVFADGEYLGTLIKTNNYPSDSVWGALKLEHPGPNTITAKAVDLAGNRSAPSNAQQVLRIRLSVTGASSVGPARGTVAAWPSSSVTRRTARTGTRSARAPCSSARCLASA